MYYTEAIVELKNIIDPVFAKRIINITKARSKKNLKVRDGLIQNIRDVKGHHLNFDTPTNLFYWNYIRCFFLIYFFSLWHCYSIVG